MKLIQTAMDLRQTVALAQARTATAGAKACTCALGPCPGWESVSDDRWPSTHLTPIATLRDAEVYEPTFDEHHPQGTRYDSADAPISVSHFPYNRCDLWQCAKCHKHLLRYTEFGGYYVDHRVRTLDTALITD